MFSNASLHGYTDSPKTLLIWTVERSVASSKIPARPFNQATYLEQQRLYGLLELRLTPTGIR